MTSARSVAGVLAVAILLGLPFGIGSGSALFGDLGASVTDRIAPGHAPARPDVGDWANLTATAGTSPASRVGASMAYDASDGCAVLFGGLGGGTLLNDTWTFSGGTWTHVNTSGHATPTPRAFAAMAFDAADGYVLLFGGLASYPATSDGKLADSWAYSGGGWTQLHPTSSPDGRFGAAMTYDSAGGDVVLFGGNSTRGAVNDTWTFAGGNWGRLSVLPSPTPRSFAAMSFDARTSNVVLAGGVGPWSEGSQPRNDTWLFANGTWSHHWLMRDEIKPMDRIGAAMASNGSATLLVGGTDYPILPTHFQVHASTRLGPLFFDGSGRNSIHWHFESWNPDLGVNDDNPSFTWDASDGYFLYFVQGLTWTFSTAR